jgi:hypothetical protein
LAAKPGTRPLGEPVIRLGPASRSCLCLHADKAALAPPADLPFEYRLGPRYLYGAPGGPVLGRCGRLFNCNLAKTRQNSQQVLDFPSKV